MRAAGVPGGFLGRLAATWEPVRYSSIMGEGAVPMSEPSASRAAGVTAGAWLPLAVAVAATLAQVAAIAAGPGEPFMDDAYISLQYARNLLRGHGLVFNPGERVEGFTHPLWVLVEAALLALRVPEVAGLAVLGVACLVGLVVTTARAAREARLPRSLAGAAPVVVAATSALSFWALSGLETVAFSWALTEGVRRHAQAARNGEIPRGPMAGALAMAVAALLRPEAVLCFAVLQLALVGQRLTGGDLARRLRAALPPVLAFVAIVGAWEIFRVGYYGAWLPNTFYAKVDEPSSRTLLHGLRYLAATVRDTPILLLLAPVVLRPRSLRRPDVRLAAAVAVALLASIAVMGGDYMPFARFVAPLVPLAALAWAGALADLLEVKTGGSRARARIVGALAATTVLWGLVPHIGSANCRSLENAVRRYRVAGAWIAAHRTPDLLVATPAAGAIAYLGGTAVLDEFGLADAFLARNVDARIAGKMDAPAGHARGHAGYVLARRPDLILLANVWIRPVPLTPEAFLGNLDETSPTDRMLMLEDAFFRDYEVLNYRLDGGAWFGMAVRRDSTFHPRSPRFSGPKPTALGGAGTR